MLSYLLYVVIFTVSSLSLCYVGKLYSYRCFYIHGICDISVSKHVDKRILKIIIGMIPVIVIYGLRDGVGQDFYAYMDIYNYTHHLSLSEFLNLNLSGDSIYYFEIGYFFLIKISPSYTILQFIVPILGYTVFTIAIMKINKYWGLSVYICLCITFPFFVNAVRYVLALCFLLLGYTFLVEKKIIKYSICVLVAVLFHKTSLVCILFILCIEFKSKRLNKIRDAFLVFAIIGFPYIINILVNIARYIPTFRRYFETGIYAFSNTLDFSFKMFFHILPVVIPLIIVFKKELVKDPKCSTALRIFSLEIPFRMLGYYNFWYSRLARIPQIIVVIMIPLFLMRITNRNVRTILIIYYILWYTFYFIYMGKNYVNPYRWILG